MQHSGLKSPDRRSLRIYASDPMIGRRANQKIAIDIENEPGLLPGPVGNIVEVVDYDGAYECYYKAVDLNAAALLMEGGLTPSEANPQFHQQMVYAVAMKVIESARRALGRPVTFRQPGRPRLRLIPHAFTGANAFFDSEQNAILFGYFKASRNNPGPNLPDQCIFTCLSHDIIAHEVTHAIVHRLRKHFLDPTNVDVLAFHEAFADIVAIFQRFTYRDILLDQLQSVRGRLEESKALVDLAQQFGYATGGGKALRSAIGKADPTAIFRIFEPHDRGAILVSAVFDGFLRVVNQRSDELFRIASGGSGLRPKGRLPQDLLGRLATETSLIADRVLRMCFRAFDYLPPIDVTFGDFLRALVTADYELNPEDKDELRYSMIEGFRARGIYPAGVASLAEEALILPGMETILPPLGRDFSQLIHELLAASAAALDQSTRSRAKLGSLEADQADASSTRSRLAAYESIVLDAEEDDDELSVQLAVRLQKYAKEHAVELGLLTDAPIAVTGFHPVFRVGPDQRLVVELVAQFVQKVPPKLQDPVNGSQVRCGATVVFGADGTPRYAAMKPWPHERLPDALSDIANVRKKAYQAFGSELSLNDARTPWSSTGFSRQLGVPLKNMRGLHGG